MNENMDLGNMKSKDIGNKISKTLVNLGKEVVNESAEPNSYVDYGNLPSRALPEMGKQVVANMIKQEEATLK